MVDKTADRCIHLLAELYGEHMAKYLIRRLLTAIPTLIVISFVVFAILDLAPNDPTGNLPMTIPPEVREQIRISLGLDEPFTSVISSGCSNFLSTNL